MTGKLFRAAAVVIVRNEARYIAEWIEYHGLLGIEHCYIFDNNSDDDLATVLRPYLIQGRATLLNWPGYPGQMSAYNYAIRMFGHACDWMTILDADEFIRLPTPGCAPDYWDGLGGDQVLMPWLLFGAGGHEEKPEGLVTESYRYRLAEPSRPVKCAVRPEAVISAEVHHCVTRDRRAVDGLGRAVPEAWQIDAPDDAGACVHHYITKSHSEWVRKVTRGQADGTIWRKEEEFLSYQGDRLDESLAGRAGEVRDAVARTAEAGEGHVSHNRSTLSELTPSRRWTLWAARRLRGLIEASEAAEHWRLAMEVDCATIHTSALVTGAMPLADFVADVNATPLNAQHLGRPCAIFRIEDEAAGEIETMVSGHDAAGRIYEHHRRLSVEAGTTIGTFILAPRTMTVDRFTWRWIDGRDGGIRIEAFSFL